ncbi:hypothetical protein BB558_002415 [Smittium angustum]|uniref:Uncharacterized protein n=1 Tax=Smittium angustum TaxID=133377 RepID=A0A2U1IZY4_SMIAN|nr:hypothetical protein BB558_005633 [Smittium angustum]PWA01488.1 hypothetical protein BB558_002415 [Smittium angustum]
MNLDLTYNTYLTQQNQHTVSVLDINAPRNLILLQKKYSELLSIYQKATIRETLIQQLLTSPSLDQETDIVTADIQDNILNDKAENSFNRISEKGRELSTLYNECIKLEAEANQLEKEIEYMTQTLKDEKLIDYTSEDKKLAEQQDTLSQKQSEISTLEYDISDLEKEISQIETRLNSENSKNQELERIKLNVDKDIAQKRYQENANGHDLRVFYNKTLTKEAWIKHIGLSKNATIDSSGNLSISIHNEFLNKNIPSSSNSTQFLLNAEIDQPNMKLSSVNISGGIDETNTQFADISRFSSGDIHTMLQRLWYIQNSS